jgi:uncharacterized protein YgiB involved in biofilm formation
MLRRIRKSSGRVTLVLIGVAALGGCGQEKRQDVYATREDCLADWGNKPEDCKPSTDPKHAGRGYFMGPLIAVPGFFGRTMGWSDSGASSSRSSRSIGSSSSSSRSSSSVSRGGFGSSSRSSGG